MQELNFNFKGERTYIQGPDVYNALLFGNKRIKMSAKLSLKF